MKKKINNPKIQTHLYQFYRQNLKMNQMQREKKCHAVLNQNIFIKK